MRPAGRTPASAFASIPRVVSISTLLPISTLLLLVLASTPAPGAEPSGSEEARRCAEIEHALANPYALSPQHEMRSAVARETYEDLRARVLSQPDREHREQLRRFYDRIECSRFSADADV